LNFDKSAKQYNKLGKEAIISLFKSPDITQMAIKLSYKTG